MVTGASAFGIFCTKYGHLSLHASRSVCLHRFEGGMVPQAKRLRFLSSKMWISKGETKYFEVLSEGVPKWGGAS